MAFHNSRWANDSFNKKIGDLIIKVDDSIFNTVKFVKIKNKWSGFDSGYNKCCSNNCINTNKPIGNCVKGFGFGNIIDEENIKYINFVDQYVLVYAENSFTKPQSCFNYSLYYFEIKCNVERELNKGLDWVYIGLKIPSSPKYINYHAKYTTIFNDKGFPLQLATSFNNNDIYGCGLVYPPTNMTNEIPYVFFTQNGKQIGKYLIRLRQIINPLGLNGLNN
ncbi:unnamed protein product [Meloidogyne enterolobii]|uniref:Uncharacterized protein n=1 Tax=Meloidogyne enterolobii TaxID=390850 RepID=A0ACB0ZAB3_MELEN